jgi:hypothetical protein
MEQTCGSKKVFDNSDYNSSDGMLTYVWGPSMWHTLHTISFNYPVNPDKDTKLQYLEFFRGLKHILPCRYCRINLVNNLRKVPLTMKTMKTRESVSRWVYNLHEEINKMLGKKSGLSYEDVRDRYEIFRARCIDDVAGKKKSKTRKFQKVTSRKTKKEKGCTNPLYGVRSKCVINIVPRDTRCKSFSIDKRCKLRRRKSKK